MGSGYQPYEAQNRQELLQAFDRNVEAATQSMRGQSNENLMKKWRLVSGGEVKFEIPRVAVVRSFLLSHMIHHRGQLSVYIRLKDIPVPAIYGPSADEST